MRHQLDDAALSALYGQHAGRARALAYLLTGDAGVAEDLVQECFLALCSRSRPVSSLDDPGAYLRRMVVNAARSRGRKLSVRHRHLAAEAASARLESDQTADGTAEHAERDAVVTALLALPVRQRTAVVLRHWLDLPEAEVAASMGCSVGTVKSLSSRGRAALRESLSFDPQEQP